MFCPQCGAEFVPGISSCNECAVALVETLPATDALDPEEPCATLVTVFEAGNAVELAVAQSILRSAGIPYTHDGELLQDLFAWGRIGAGYNVPLGPIRLKVSDMDQERAKALLVNLDASRVELPAEEDVVIASESETR